MTLKYESELIKEIVDTRGHETPLLHYESECVESWISESEGAYPKLTDYEAEWLNYIVENPIGKFPYVTLSDVTEATVENVVPYAYKSAILKDSTKYRDIDTGEFLETFEEGRNLELVPVKMPVLTTYTNLFTGFITKGYIENGVHFGATSDPNLLSDYIEIFAEHLAFRRFKKDGTPVNSFGEFAFYDADKNFIDRRTGKVSVDESVTVPENTKYIRVWSRPTDDGIDEIAMLIYSKEKPSTITEYQPCKTNILTVNEEVELRGIGDVKDELDLLTGELTQRIGEIVLDGSEDENWSVGTHTSVIDYYRCSINIYHGKSTDKLICNNFKQSTDTSLKNEKLIFIGDGGTQLFFNIEKSYLPNGTVEELRKYLEENIIVVQYPLKTPVVKTVELTVTDQDGNATSIIRPIEGTMHLSTSSDTIEPTFTGEVPVEAINQNLVSFIEG